MTKRSWGLRKCAFLEVILVTIIAWLIYIVIRDINNVILSALVGPKKAQKRNPLCPFYEKGPNMDEKWLTVEEFPDYVVSNYGEVYNGNTGRILSENLVQYGIPTVGLYQDGKQYRRSVPVLVALAFLDAPPYNPLQKYAPIHLDGDRQNCRADNLMWRPRWFAVNYHRERLQTSFPNWTAPFECRNTGEIFEHPRDAAMKYGLLETHIHMSVIYGKPVYPGDYHFRKVNA